MSKKHKKFRTQEQVRNDVMGKFGKFRGKTGKFVDWNEVDKATMGNPLDIFGFLKKVFNIAMGKKDENKA